MAELPAVARRALTPGPMLDRIGLGCLLLLPPMLLHGRAIADILISVIGLLLLLRSARGGGWAWLRQPWVAVAASLWVWMVVCTALAGTDARSLAQSVVSVRLLLLVAACQEWLLRPARARQWLGYVFSACAAWLVLEVWQQYLLGYDVAGYRRSSDGVLTGPFQKERAGAMFLDLFFPAVLPIAMQRLAARARGVRVGGLLVLLLASASMVLIGQRMPTLLMLFGLVVTGLVVRELRWPVVGVLAVCALVIAALPVISPPTFQRLVLHFLEQMRHFWISDYGQIYVRAIEMVRAEPWFGLGYDGFRNNCMEWRFIHGSSWVDVTDAQVSIEGGCNIHPHNYWLEMATSFGVPGMLLFTALVGVWLVSMARALPRQGAPIDIAAFIATVVLFWPFASRSSLFVVDAGGWAFLIAGLGLAAARGRTRAD